MKRAKYISTLAISFLLLATSNSFAEEANENILESLSKLDKVKAPATEILSKVVD